MIDELLNERIHPAEPRQEHIVEKYCTGISTKLATAKSKSDAISIVIDTCRELDSTCESDILKFAIRHYLLDIIDHQWETTSISKGVSQ